MYIVTEQLGQRGNGHVNPFKAFSLFLVSLQHTKDQNIVNQNCTYQETIIIIDTIENNYLFLFLLFCFALFSFAGGKP